MGKMFLCIRDKHSSGMMLMSCINPVQVCKEAEITEIATDSREQTQSVYLVKGSEGPTKSDRKKDPPTDT